MSRIKENVDRSSTFYAKSFLGFDYKLADYNYKTIKPFFNGELGLELGPASGYMTKYLVNDFKELHLVEGSNDLLNGIPAYPNCKKFNSLFEDYEASVKYDTIVMGHVLEHIFDPIFVLKRIKNWLKDDGVLIISVPNAQSIHRLAAVEMNLLKSIYDLNQRDVELGHYRVYDLNILHEHVTTSGLRVLNSGGIFLKPLSNGQIETNWTDQMIEGFYQLGKKFPSNCAEIYAVCSK